MPAKAGIQRPGDPPRLDSRLRGNDTLELIRSKKTLHYAARSFASASGKRRDSGTLISPSSTV